MPRLALLCLLAMIAAPMLVSAFSCPPCGTFDCPVRDDCKFGVTKDACNCCDECWRGENEVCGGRWNPTGRCAEGLECIFPNVTGVELYNSDGVCTVKKVAATTATTTE